MVSKKTGLPPDSSYTTIDYISETIDPGSDQPCGRRKPGDGIGYRHGVGSNLGICLF